MFPTAMDKYRSAAAAAALSPLQGKNPSQLAGLPCAAPKRHPSFARKDVLSAQWQASRAIEWAKGRDSIGCETLRSPATTHEADAKNNGWNRGLVPAGLSFGSINA